MFVCRCPAAVRPPRAVLLGGLVLGALLAGGGCRPPQGPQGQGPGHRPQSLGLTPQQEYSLGEQAYEEVLGKFHVVRRGPEVERVRRVGERIVATPSASPR